MTLVDDQQIDCVIRREGADGTPDYLDIQIKARSDGAKNGATFSAMTVRHPRPNFWFIFYSETASMYSVILSEDVVKLVSVNKGGTTGKHKGKLSFVLCSQTKKGLTPRQKFRAYENAFDRLQRSETEISARVPSHLDIAFEGEL